MGGATLFPEIFFSISKVEGGGSLREERERGLGVKTEREIEGLRAVKCWGC